MNDLTMCLKWRPSGAVAAVRSHLCLCLFQMKLKATRRLGIDNAAQTAPSYTLMDTAVYLCCGLQWGNCPPAPNPPSPQFCWDLISGGQTQRFWWENSGDDLRTVLHISGAQAGCFPQRCWKRRPSGVLRRNCNGCSLGKNHTWNQWQEIYSLLKSRSRFR